MEILEVKNLQIDYISSKKIEYSISNINFKLLKGKNLGIVGESGCGKSTIAKAILNILPENTYIDGEVLLDGVNILRLNKKAMDNIRGTQLSMIFQDPILALNPIRKIKNQFYDLLEGYKKINGKEKTDEYIRKKLEEVNLKDTNKILNSYPFELSGGMAQRVVISMATINNPKILIADEPTSSIDAVNRVEILSDMKKLEHMSIIMISHNLNEVYMLCDEVIVMYNGKILEQGKVEDVFHNPSHEYTKSLIESEGLGR